MAKYKVGDKVVVRSDLNEDDVYYMDDRRDYWYAGREMVEKAGTVVTISELDSDRCYYRIKGDEENYPYNWSCEMFSGLANESKPIPIPVKREAPIKRNTDPYANACYYCRKGGLVDRYMNSIPYICPVCGRVSGMVTSSVTVFNESLPKPNKPLSNDELKALPDATRVFTVATYNGVEQFKNTFTCWRTKKVTS